MITKSYPRDQLLILQHALESLLQFDLLFVLGFFRFRILLILLVLAHLKWSKQDSGREPGMSMLTR